MPPWDWGPGKKTTPTSPKQHPTGERQQIENRMKIWLSVYEDNIIAY